MSVIISITPSKKIKKKLGMKTSQLLKNKNYFA